MAIEFCGVRKETRFLDPMSGFAESKRFTEIRTDPLTGLTSRILQSPPYLPSESDLTPVLERSARNACPFCPDRLMAVTPHFPPDIVSEPRIKMGDAVVVCNILPYDTYSAVCVMTSQHYVSIGEFTEELLTDALQASQAYIQAVLNHDPNASYGSINWNYMPLSGGSLVHPHLQVIVGETPSNYHRTLLESSGRYFEDNSSSYWADLIATERQLDLRYLANTGIVHWLVSFAPRGLIEVMGVFTDRIRIPDLSRQDWQDFASGLVKVMRYLGDLNFQSLNMAIFSGRQGDDHFWVNARIIPRFLLLPALGTSDINYFGALHGEVLTRVKPEDTCRDLRPYFE